MFFILFFYVCSSITRLIVDRFRLFFPYFLVFLTPSLNQRKFLKYWCISNELGGSCPTAVIVKWPEPAFEETSYDHEHFTTVSAFLFILICRNLKIDGTHRIYQGSLLTEVFPVSPRKNVKPFDRNRSLRLTMSGRSR